MKIVPTTYEDLGGTKIVAYQYTYAYRSYVAFGHGGKVIPAVWFRSDNHAHMQFALESQLDIQ